MTVEVTIEKRHVYSPDDVLENLGKKHKPILFCIIVGSLAMISYGGTNLSSAFINKSCKNCSDSSFSIVDEFDLHGTFWQDVTSTSFMIGNMIGGVFVSQAADNYGRRPVLLVTYPLVAVCGLCAAYAPNVIIFAIFRCLQGVFYTSSALASWVLCYETSPVALRFFTNVVFGFGWVLGYCLVAPLAYISPTWRWLLVLTSLLYLPITVLCYLYQKESLHFLIANNRMNEVQDWLEYMKSKSIKTEQIQTTSSGKEQTKGFSLFVEFWKHKRLLLYTLVLTYIWVADTFIYFGLSLFSTHLAGNIYVNYLLLGLVELPACIIAPVFMEKVGRRLALFYEHLLIAFSFAALIFAADNHALRIVLWMTGKFAASCAFLTIFAVGSELFPTNVRNVSIGLCETMSRIGGILAPHIAKLSAISAAMPNIVILFVALSTSLLILILPETLNKPLPATMQETSDRK